MTRKIMPTVSKTATSPPSSEWLLPAVSVLVALLAASSLWGPGMVNTRGGGDSPFLLQRTLDMADNLRHGIFPPRWMAHAAYDLGYPMFNHYAALPYYLSGGLAALGLSPIVSIQATQTLGFILATLTMALWAGRIYRNRPAILLAVTAYTFAPFHLVNVYVRGDSLSEFYAFVCYPLILWTMDKLAERYTHRHVAAAALAYGALILTHNVSALIFAPFALLYAWIKIANATSGCAKSANLQITKNSTSSPSRSHVRGSRAAFSRFTHHTARTFLPFILAFLLSAWFWMPAILETKYGQMGEEFTEGYFHYSQHFRGPNLVQPSFAFDYSVAIRTEDAGPFAMGLAQAGLAAAGAALISIRVAKRSDGGGYVTGFILFGLGLSTLMITPLSKPLWNHLPLLEITQFPWRFLSIQALFTAIASGAIGESTNGNRRLHQITKSPNQQISASEGILNQQIANSELRIANAKSKNQQPVTSNQHPASNIQHLASIPHSPTPPILPSLLPATLALLIIAAALIALRPERLRIDAADVTWENALFYETFTGNIGTTIRYEYLPRDVNPRLYISESVIDGQGRVIAEGDNQPEATLLRRTPTKQTWQVSLAQAAPVSFPLNAWPGWQVSVNGAHAAAYPLPGSGRLALDLPAGEHTIELRLRNTPLRTVAIAISVVTALGMLAHGIMQNPQPRAWIERALTAAKRYGPLATGMLILCVLVPALLQKPAPPATFFNFHKLPYPHAGPVSFAAGQLEAVTLSATTAQPGDVLDITHTWTLAEPGTPTSGTLRLVSPAEPRHGIIFTLTSAPFTLTHSGNYTTRLSLPPDLARGLYLIELRAGPEAGGQYVGSVRVPHGPVRRTYAPTLGTFRDLTLHSVDATQPDAGTLHIAMAWSGGGTARNWSLSLRLLDVGGRQIGQQDPETHGYGYLPASLWLPGELVTDHIVFPLPAGLAPGTYILRVITYLRATGEGGGQVDVPIELSIPTKRNLGTSSDTEQSPILCKAGGVALVGLDMPTELPEGQALDFQVQWNAIQVPDEDISVTWTLLTPDQTAITSEPGPVAAGSRTSTWPQHTWAQVPVRIDMPASSPPGNYRIQVMLTGKDNAQTTCTLTMPLTITPRPRSFTVPSLPHPQTATFEDTQNDTRLALLGYNVTRQPDTVLLTLWWQADTQPERDYKRFVHVYDPSSGSIVTQDDAMPRAWTYPTTLWVAGEVVSETVGLNVSSIPKGNYPIIVGWYDPETGTRLTLSGPSSQAPPADQIELETKVKLP